MSGIEKAELVGSTQGDSPEGDLWLGRSENPVARETVPFPGARDGPQSPKLGRPGADWVMSLTQGREEVCSSEGQMLQWTSFLFPENYKVVPSSVT